MSKQMAEEVYKHSALTSKIIGAAMAVHTGLGNGFQEVIYQRALAIELGDRNIAFCREFEMPIYYKNQHIGGVKGGDGDSGCAYGAGDQLSGGL
jgi:hypothetical protein